MNHGITGTAKLINCDYVFTLKVRYKEQYWNINLKENEANAKVVQEKLWTRSKVDFRGVLVNISTNNKYCNLTVASKIYVLSINDITPTSEQQIEQIKIEEEKKARKQKAIALSSKVIGLIRADYDFAERAEDIMHILIARIPVSELERPIEIFEEIIEIEEREL